MKYIVEDTGAFHALSTQRSTPQPVQAMLDVLFTKRTSLS